MSALTALVLGAVIGSAATGALVASGEHTNDAAPIVRLAVPMLARDATGKSPQEPTPIALEHPTVLPDGLKYVDQVVGTGVSPNMAQSVTVHYTAWLAASSKLIETTKGQQPRTFAMKDVVKGFSEAVSTMRVRGKRTVFIPAALAYGGKGAPGVPANADLIFEIELIAVK